VVPVGLQREVRAAVGDALVVADADADDVRERRGEADGEDGAGEGVAAVADGVGGRVDVQPAARLRLDLVRLGGVEGADALSHQPVPVGKLHALLP